MTLTKPHLSTDRKKQRQLGSFYTPRAITEYIVRGCLKPFLDLRSCNTTEPIRILDPACGNGAFLLSVFDYLEVWYREHDRNPKNLTRTNGNDQLTTDARLQIIRDHLFGVDVDATALDALHVRLFGRVNPEPSAVTTTWNVIRASIRVGDALTGPDFHETDQVDPEREAPESLNWRAAFPHVAQSGGFEVILGNPPYRRELNAKNLFDRIAGSRLGRKWRQARMDLWYYFLHRGLDLLCPGGVLSFIVNSYWTASAGARKLICRLEREVTFEEFVILGKASVFHDVAGRHLIFRLRKGRRDDACQVIDLSRSEKRGQVQFSGTARDQPAVGARLRTNWTCPLFSPNARDVERYEVARYELFQHEQIVLSRPDSMLTRLGCLRSLGEIYEVRQGMAENPPVITPRIGREFADRFQVGAGVFVLTPDEVEQLELSDNDRRLLRPYYDVSSLGRYRIPVRPTHFVLYSTRETAPTLDGFPGLRRHLAPFRPILHRRRETRTGHGRWWQLHWPREERLFTQLRILSVQMGRVPQFVWAEQSTFVGFSVNLILAASDGGFDLSALTGILNSSLAQSWFSKFAKRRGINLEINGTLLKRFPLPERDPTIEQQLAKLAARRQQVERWLPNDDVSSQVARIEREIDKLVCRLYGVELGSLVGNNE